MTTQTTQTPAPAGATTVAELAARVQLLEDKAALRALMVKGWRALDLNDFETWIDCWAQDAVFDFGPWGVLYGRQAIYDQVHSSEVDYAHMLHHILNMDFHVDGDAATGVGFMWFVGRADADITAAHLSMGGPYDWEYRREPDSWRISKMTLGLWYRHGEDTIHAFTSKDGES